MAYLIQNGTIITAAETFGADIYIEGEKIVEIGVGLIKPGVETVNAQGKLILPGGVDPHTHFDLPMFDTISSDDHYTGHKAAAFGGTTIVIDFVPQDSPSLVENIERWSEKASPNAAIDYGFHMNVTNLLEETLSEMHHLPDLGISTVKVFMAYNDRLRLQDGEIYQVLCKARELGMLTMLHAENGDVIELEVEKALRDGHKTVEWHAKTRPAWGAVEATLRGAALAAQANTPIYIVHMNAAGEVDQLAYARDKGVHVMGETCPQYLFFIEGLLKRSDGAKWVCSPPLRTSQDNTRLMEGLSEGIIQVVGTDHCPFFYNGRQSILYEGVQITIPGKELGAKDFTKIPNGLPVVGDRLPILWTHAVGTRHLTANQFVQLTSTNPAKIFGLYPQKGAILVGSDADLVIWDPDRQVTYGVAYAQHRTDYNLFEGWNLVGFPDTVFLRGRIIVDHGAWLGERGSGKFLHRSCHAPVL